MSEADIIVIKDESGIKAVYRPRAVVAVLSAPSGRKHPPNVIFVHEKFGTQILVRAVGKMLGKHVLI